MSLGGAAALTVTSNRRTSHGVELGYGSLSGARWLRIAELKSPPDRSAWLGIPHGFVRIQGTKYRSYDGHIAQHWTGDLVTNGIYVTIETSLGRDGLVAAARALKSV